MEEKIVPAVEEASRQAVLGMAPFTLAFRRVGGMGDGPSRVWVLMAVSEPFQRAAITLRDALTPFGEVARDRKTPRPHVTLARAREPRTIAPRAVDPPVISEVSGVVLFESFLEPQGARYRVRARWRLGAAD